MSEKQKLPKGPASERKAAPLDQSSPLDGLLEDPKATDHGIASLDKALWDPSRDRSEVERDAEKP
jgi:hypothetical protein